MDPTLNPDLAALQRLTTSDLRRRYAEAFGDRPASWNRVWLLRRLAWRLQELAEGGLSERARRRAEELANDADLRMTPPRSKTDGDDPAPERTAAAPPAKADERLPPPGTILSRPYKGRALQVQVLTDGFAFEGRVYPSLSAVAKAATGSHCNGFLFFRNALNHRKEAP